MTELNAVYKGVNCKQGDLPTHGLIFKFRRETAAGKQGELNFFNFIIFHQDLSFLLEIVQNTGANRMNCPFALTHESNLLGKVDRENINLRVPIPPAPDPFRDKVQFACLCQTPGECDRRFLKCSGDKMIQIRFDPLLENRIRQPKVKTALIGVNIAKPEPQEMVVNLVNTLFTLFRLRFGSRHTPGN